MQNASIHCGGEILRHLNLFKHNARYPAANAQSNSTNRRIKSDECVKYVHAYVCRASQISRSSKIKMDNCPAQRVAIAKLGLYEG